MIYKSKKSAFLSVIPFLALMPVIQINFIIAIQVKLYQTMKHVQLITRWRITNYDCAGKANVF